MARLLPLGGVAPRVAPSAWLAPDATLIGDVVVHEEANLWFGVVARGDAARIEIGRAANVQDGVVLHADPGQPLSIGAEAAIGHGAVVHGCRLAEGVLVGMGAVVLTGAVVGEGSVVAAGAVVLEGAEVPPRTLVAGVPARPIREVDGAPGRETCRRYLQRVAEYRSCLADS